MTRQLVFVHGRSQEHKEAVALKKEWLDALAAGLEKSGLKLPIPESQVRFPYYGDALFDLVDGKPPSEAAEIIVRSGAPDRDEERFARAIMRDIQEKAGISDAELAAVAGQEVVERGPLEWEWFQGLLRAVDRYVPYGSGQTIALFTHDVYQYLKNSVIRERIDEGVSAAISKDVETVVVAHSLGTVVAYHLLRQQGLARGWKCVQLITLGSPLGVEEIRKSLRKLAPTRCPECVKGWFNAMDERDIVALYPLNTDCFPLDPITPAIENKLNVRNNTSNRHGISGYLDDQEVARRIYDALTAP